MLLSNKGFGKRVCGNISLNKNIVAFTAAGIKRLIVIHIIARIKSVVLINYHYIYLNTCIFLTFFIFGSNRGGSIYLFFTLV